MHCSRAGHLRLPVLKPVSVEFTRGLRQGAERDKAPNATRR